MNIIISVYAILKKISFKKYGEHIYIIAEVSATFWFLNTVSIILYIIVPAKTTVINSNTFMLEIRVKPNLFIIK